MDGENVTEASVERGSNKTFIIIADEGYKIISVKVNDVEAQLNNGLLVLKGLNRILIYNNEISETD